MITDEIFIGVFSSFAVIVAGAFYWLLSEIRAIRTEIRQDKQQRQTEREADRRERQAEREADRRERQAEREADKQERRADTQRILEALYFHRHDPNSGEAVFYPPTPAPPSAD